MKKPIIAGLVSLALLGPQARAWTYSDGDVLLIFRESGFNNVEFDIGNISQFLNQAQGTTAPVSGFDLSIATGVFGTDLTGVSVVLAATTSSVDANRSAWLSASSPTVLPVDPTPSGWQSDLWSVINGIGTKPLSALVPVAGPAAYSIDPQGVLRIASYDYVVSPTGTRIPQLGGHVGFTVETVIPGSFLLWQISPSSAVPKPAATLVGTFNITAAGALTFTAGPPVPGIVGLNRSTGLSTVTFTTAPGGNYYLAYTNDLTAPLSTWPRVSGPLVGSGNTASLVHTNSDNSGFYRVLRAP
ncbi:MAG: hypothetical protein U1F98_03130 [Verrucomicrobiota bacterium]